MLAGHVGIGSQSAGAYGDNAQVQMTGETISWTATCDCVSHMSMPVAILPCCRLRVVLSCSLFGTFDIDFVECFQTDQLRYFIVLLNKIASVLGVRKYGHVCHQDTHDGTGYMIRCHCVTLNFDFYLFLTVNLYSNAPHAPNSQQNLRDMGWNLIHAHRQEAGCTVSSANELGLPLLFESPHTLQAVFCGQDLQSVTQLQPLTHRTWHVIWACL